MTEPTVTLADRVDALNFKIGAPVVLDSSLHRVTGLRLMWQRVRWRMVRLTRWWRPRTVVSAINRDEGKLTFVVERWSWRRWRWERAL